MCISPCILHCSPYFYPSMCNSVYLCVWPLLSPFKWIARYFFCVLVLMSIYVYPSVLFSICLFLYPFMCIPKCLSACIPLYVPPNISLCASFHLFFQVIFTSYVPWYSSLCDPWCIPPCELPCVLLCVSPTSVPQCVPAYLCPSVCCRCIRWYVFHVSVRMFLCVSFIVSKTRNELSKCRYLLVDSNDKQGRM